MFLIDKYLYFFKKIEVSLLPFLVLYCRFVVASAFFSSGLNKIATWDSTLYLFEYEYNVPIIPWEWAAYLGTFTELFFSVLLILGLFTRMTALILFIFNIIAVISYETLWAGGFYDHQLWGLMLLITFLFGGKYFSLDHLYIWYNSRSKKVVERDYEI